MMKQSKIIVVICILLTINLRVASARESIILKKLPIFKSGNNAGGEGSLNNVKFKSLSVNNAQADKKIKSVGNKITISVIDTTKSSYNTDTILAPVAFKSVERDRLPIGVSNVDVAQLFEKNYSIQGLEGLEAFASGYNGNNLWGMNSSLVLVDGVPRDISTINVSEIAQVSFLKSASAIALYGSRGAKGVILVQTKRGGNEQQSIKVRANAGLNTPKGFPSYLGSAEYMTLYNEARQNDGLPASYTADEIYQSSIGTNPYRFPNLDFYSSDYIKNSFARYDLITEISGGNQKAKYYTNVGFNSTGSLLNFGEGKGNTADRFNIRGNVDMKITKGINARVDASAVFFNQNGVNTDYWGSAASIRPNRFTPLIPINLIEPGDEASLNYVKSSGNIVDGKYLLGGTPFDQTNPFATIYVGGKNKNVSRQFQFTTGIDGDLKGLLKGLSFNTNLGIDFYSTYNQGYNNGYATYQPNWTTYSGKYLIGSLTKFGQDTKSGNQNVSASDYRQTISLSGQLNYNTTVNDAHHISAILLANGFQQTFSEVYQKTTNSNSGLQLGYDFNRKYFAELTGALVYSPKLAGSNRTEFSPAGSLGWMISEEPFFKNISFISRLKLSASGGILYTDLDINDYFLYQGIYTQTDGTWFSWNDGVLVRTTDSRRGVNPNLKMAKREEFTFGIEGQMFKNALSFGANFFRSNMVGNIVQSNVLYPSYFSTGYPNSSFIPYVNYNEDQRQGVDFYLNFNKQIGEVNWIFGTSATYYNTKAIKRAESVANDYQLTQGKALDGIWGLKSDGFYMDASEAEAANNGDGLPKPAFGTVSAGDIKYKDINNDGTINDQDQVYLGKGGWDGSPFTLGLNLTAKWKNFTVFALATGRFGASGIKGSNYYWVNGEDKYSVEVRNRWTEQTKTTATFPRLTTLSGDNNFRNSDFWLYSTDRFDLSKIQVSYNISSKILKSKLFKELGIYVTGFNLLTFAKEREMLALNVGGVPQTRLYNLGVKASF
ncbi:MAG TPA: SusC/RagA family TonB-linked outer membrane protein [Arachidicoccus soli]|nr:SusC/RagA family TonB-linked outer membrane protein [Arachidicoccus soli]